MCVNGIYMYSKCGNKGNYIPRENEEATILRKLQDIQCIMNE